MWDTATSRCVRRHALTSDGAMSMLESPKPISSWPVLPCATWRERISRALASVMIRSPSGSNAFLIRAFVSLAGQGFAIKGLIFLMLC